MSENTERTNGNRDPETGQFLVGHSGNGGRKPGSRNKLAGALVDALHDDFSQHGIAAIERVRAEDPVAYLRVICAILPKELDIALNVNSDLFAEARDFAQAYRLAKSYIGAEIESEEQPLIEGDLIEVEADETHE
jgi:hypothetical protein